MKLHHLLLLVTCIAILAAVPASADGNMACSCTATACGNNAVGGDQGDIFTGLSEETVKTKFQTNPDTGWTCVVPAKIRGEGGPKGCFCAKLCGNGGVGADPNFFDLGLTQEEIDEDYGGGGPGNPTGWLCGNYRGTIS